MTIDASLVDTGCVCLALQLSLLPFFIAKAASGLAL